MSALTGSTWCQTIKPPHGKQFVVQEGKLTVSQDKIFYSYAPSKDLSIPVSIDIHNVTELQFTAASARHNIPEDMMWPDWGSAVKFVGPVVGTIQLAKSTADLIAIQFVENNETKALVLQVPSGQYEHLMKALNTAMEHKYDTTSQAQK